MVKARTLKSESCLNCDKDQGVLVFFLVKDISKIPVWITKLKQPDQPMFLHSTN